MHKRRPIRVWRFDEAPWKYRRLSQNGGDEDWVAFVPGGEEAYGWIPWLEVPHFACWKVEVHQVPEGEVYIGCHA